MADYDDTRRYRREYRTPYTGRKNIPTVQQYRKNKGDLQSRYAQLDDDEQVPSTTQAYIDWARQYWYGETPDGQEPQDPKLDRESTHRSSNQPNDEQPDTQPDQKGDGDTASGMQDTTEAAPLSSDLKARRKQLSNRKAVRAEREVTDPITHMPVKIHDFTDAELKDVQEQDEESAGGLKRLFNKLKGRTNSDLAAQADELEKRHESLDRVFPPPEYELLKEDLEGIFRQGIFMGVGGVGGILASSALCWWALGGILAQEKNTIIIIFLHGGLLVVFPLMMVGLVFYSVQKWATEQARGVIDDDVWDNKDTMAAQATRTEMPESCHWLNKMLRSIWPLVNPDLFDSLADLLEDVMQASLPKLVQMVHVEDIGQGSESIRVLGIKWLPKGAAGKSLKASGDLEDGEEEDKSQGIASQDKARRDATSVGKHGDDKATATKDDSSKEKQQSEDGRDQDNAEKMPPQRNLHDDDDDAQSNEVTYEAEEGEFLNMEIAFAYKTNKYRKSMKSRAQHAHLFLAFYLFGGIKLPVWVELRGVVGTMRCRMQLCPDPPFVSLTTITFLGQPNVDISCFPLSKRGLNIMDLPLISNFVQDAVDAAVSQYVAPKSLSIDLKAMLAGDDFKRDTSALGVVVVQIKRAFDFKAGDTSIPLVREGSSDSYVTVGWAKFGKPIFSTRVITKDMEPYWQEEAFCLVGPEEIDAEENLRLQLWDSDRFTADDDLGRIEVSLEELMKSEKTRGKLDQRVDPFQALKAGESMPGRCEWSVGYFPKTGLLPYQMKEQCIFESLHDEKSLRDHIYQKAASKLRETSRDERREAQQQQEQDFAEAQTKVISSTRPPEQYPSGILSVQIHQIVGLSRESLSRTREHDGGERQGEEEQADSLPSSYATIILNGKKMYRTRVKPQNSKPFFNAGCERYIRDWRTAEVYISVRDARLHENDPLLGLVYLPLAKMFRKGKTSHFNAFFPLVGGIGYGRARISVVFRSVEMQAPLPALGWEVGNVRVEPRIVGTEGLSSELKSCKLILRTPMARRKMYPTSQTEQGEDQGHGLWASRHSHVLMLPVRKRYAVCLLVEFRSTTRRLIGGVKTPGYAVLWLQDIPDDEQQEVTLTVHKGDMWRAALNALPDELRGEKQGTIKLQVTFVRGMSKFHRPLAKGNQDVQNIFELLEVAADCGLIRGIVGDGIQHKKTYRPALDENGVPLTKDNEQNADIDSDADLDSDDDTSDERDESEVADGDSSVDIERAEADQDNAEGGKGGIKGIAADIRGYKRHKDQLHRKHRGMMQWKPVRTADWLKSKTGSIGHRISGSFELKGKEPQIETEV